MKKSPFKFLDSYTKEDRDIFFGRDREIEELYQKTFESKIILVSGVSGTGKSSLIHCGLANEFEESDWLPVNVRRGKNITESLVSELRKVAISPLPPDRIVRGTPPRGRHSDAPDAQGGDKPAHIVKALQSIYLDHFKPIFLIFDQFEELFIFGSKEERQEFIKDVKEVVNAELQCKLIFVIRDEYLAWVIEFEREIPTFLVNRMRIEKMTWVDAKKVIEEPCKVNGIKVEEGLAETILGKLSPESTEVELTYLQVLLDKMYRLSQEHTPSSGHPSQEGKEEDSSETNDKKEKQNSPLSRGVQGGVFSFELLEKIGDVSDLLGSFLEDQITQLDNPDVGLVVLKSFVSIKGTKKQITLEEISEFARTFGQEISQDDLKNLITSFVNLRILRDKDEADRYELRHDSLATKIYEKITLVEKELLEVRQFIDNAYSNFEKRRIYLSNDDLKYIAPYEDKLFLNQRLEKFLGNSKKQAQKIKRRRRNIAIVSAVVLIGILSAFSVWAVIEKGNATRALEEKEAAEMKLDEAAKDFVLKADKMNILYKGVDNPMSLAIPGRNIGRVIMDTDLSGLKPVNWSMEGNIIRCYSTGIANIIVKQVLGQDTVLLGTRTFRVKNLPTPVATLNGKNSGFILRDSLATTRGIKAIIPDFDYNYSFDVISYNIHFNSNGISWAFTRIYNNNISDNIRELLKRVDHNSSVQFTDITVLGSDSVVKNIGTLSLTVVRWMSYDNYIVFKYSIEEAIMNKDWKKLKELTIENMDRYYLDNIYMLNTVAYEFYLNIEDTEALTHALKWAERLNELQKDRPMYLDTYASLLYKLGRKDEAIFIQEKAIRIAKEKGESTSELELFLNKIKNN